MIGTLLVGGLALSLVLAAWVLWERYLAYFRVGSRPWNAHQLALREELARVSARGVDAEEAREAERKEREYAYRLAQQLTAGIFTDDTERRRAERIAQQRRLEAVQVYDALRREEAAD